MDSRWISQFSSRWISAVFCVAYWTFVPHIAALNNGLVLTPPMGWLAWERFRCNIDCKIDPENCISENLFMAMAKRVAEDGFKDAGYEYIIIDDCWMKTTRDADGRLQADAERFPNGIKYLANYVHSLGLKMGIYQDIGTKTCIGYPGSQGYEKIDVETFASWDVDYLKLDGCFMDSTTFDKNYPVWTQLLNRTSRPIVFSCSWPAYQVERKMTVNWAAIKENCNLWRNFGDIQDSYESITNIIDWYATNQDILTSVAGPGAWNDPDMLIIGNFGLSLCQAQSQMALWAVMAAPLMMSNDLRNLRPEFKEILLNRDIIAVDQDVLGIQGRQILPARQGQGVEVWRRPVMPVMQIANETWASFAVVCWNRRVDGMPFAFNRQLGFYGLTHPGGYFIKELFTQTEFGLMKADDYLKIQVNPAGGVFFFKATLAVADKTYDPHKMKEAQLLRERIRPPVYELRRPVKPFKPMIAPDDAGFLEDSPVSSNVPMMALQFFAVIIVLALLVRLVGFRFGLPSLLRLSRRVTVSFKRAGG